MRRHISLKIFMDLKVFFDVVSMSTKTSKNRVMIDAKDICRAIGKQGISTLGYIRSENNSLVALTRMKKFAPLMKCILQNKCVPAIEQYVVRA